jgi:hypothetical protein
VTADGSMALVKPAFGHHIDVHSEEILDGVCKPDEGEEALASWHRDEQVEVTAGKIVATGDRPEHAWVPNSKVARQAQDLIAVHGQC